MLDFAAMEQLLAKLEASTTDSSVMVLDLGQVIELPPSSGALLQRQAQRLQAAGVPLLLCRVDHLELPDARPETCGGRNLGTAAAAAAGTGAPGTSAGD